MTHLDRAREATRAVLAARPADRSSLELDLARALRVDEDVPPGKACLWLMPDGTATGVLRDAMRAWRAEVSGREPGRPGRPPREGGRHRVEVVLDDETAAIWRGFDGDRSAWVRDLIRGYARRWAPCSACGGAGYEVGGDGEREDCMACDPRRRA